MEGLKAKYRELCKTHHPDLGGDLETMKAINLEYEQMLKVVTDREGKPLTEDETEIQKDIMDIVNQIIVLRGLIIEITGRWVWVTGETYTWKDSLKALGFFWAHKKGAWYWRPDDAKVSSRRSTPMELIRAKYGSKVLESESSRALA